MSERREIVTIDGPSGVGKSTISRRVAAALGYTYLDTGAMYRAVALFLQQSQIDLSDEQAVSSTLAALDLQLLPAVQEDGDVGVVVNGQDVSSAIRTSEMGMLASRVSAIPLVRKRLTEMQQAIGQAGKIVAEGRDTGTVVFPDACWKFFLEADPEERARRRMAQLRAAGQEVDAEELLAMIVKRDRDDQERTLAPLQKAEDAIVIDTTFIDIQEVCRKMLEFVQTKKLS
ncbi:MAG: (d)CMP kinase [Proteobacteria bacterium]|nr:(d)CMP kinase [Pseudomonadota bacterium]MBU1650175.1 (d)CMP kinase [Pseudomonadota bacterium]MBU1986444.1 (d)CMP kinase [Pseudomonadota bacterium]